MSDEESITFKDDFVVAETGLIQQPKQKTTSLSAFLKNKKNTETFKKPVKSNDDTLAVLRLLDFMNKYQFAFIVLALYSAFGLAVWFYSSIRFLIINISLEQLPPLIVYLFVIFVALSDKMFNKWWNKVLLFFDGIVLLLEMFIIKKY